MQTFYCSVELYFQKQPAGLAALEVHSPDQPSPLEIAQLALDATCLPDRLLYHPTAWSASVVIRDSQLQELAHETLSRVSLL